MTCKNCTRTGVPGQTIRFKGDYPYIRCADCGELIPLFTSSLSVSDRKWDTYFHSICIAVSSKSPCLSRKIGAILVKDHSIISTGFNGPSQGIPHCGHERMMRDNSLIAETLNWASTRLNPVPHPDQWRKECPRRLLNFGSGTGMQWCSAQHAEANAISNAARLGVSVFGATLYMNCVTPCKNCYGTLINAGIVEIVVDDLKLYDEHTQYLIDNSTIKIRSFHN